MYSLLPPNGRILIFVPANQWLMGSMDRQLGHFRRYSMNELTTKCRAAGFQIRGHSSFRFHRDVAVVAEILRIEIRPHGTCRGAFLRSVGRSSLALSGRYRIATHWQEHHRHWREAIMTLRNFLLAVVIYSLAMVIFLYPLPFHTETRIFLKTATPI